MHDAHELDLGMLGQVAIDVAGIDRVVVGHLELVQLGAVVAQPVAHVAPEHARDDVQARGARLHETARRRLEAQDRLALHEQDVLARAVQLADLALRAPEAPRGTPGRSGSVIGADWAASTPGHAIVGPALRVKSG